VHRNDDADFADDYDGDATTLDEANAVSSQAWEIVSLKKHYYLPIAEVAKKMGEEVKVLPFPLEDAARETMKDVFAREVGKDKGRVEGTFEAPGDSLWY
jgi:hypothetical protein